MGEAARTMEAELAGALGGALRAKVCDDCYEDGCVNGYNGGLCPCRRACHRQQDEAEKRAKGALEEWARRKSAPAPAAAQVRAFGLWRGGERKADVVVLTSGKCVVGWPTSVVVYDSLEAAQAVHIAHMGGRGEPTEFRPEPAPGP